MRASGAPWLVTSLLLVTLAGCLDGGDADGLQGVETATAGPVPAGDYRFDGFARVLEDGPLDVLPLQKTYLASAVDGVEIEVGIWLPELPSGQKVPVIVDAGPYYGNNGPPMEAVPSTLNKLIQNYVPHGYAVAAVAVRGTGGSGGCMDLMGPTEVADLSQAITWLGEQSWSSGSVAMIGKSYDGSTPWMVAGTGNPYLKTIIPVSGVTDLYELMFHNGTSEIRGPGVLNGLYYSFAVREQADPVTGETSPTDYARRTAEAAACPDHVEGLLAPAYSGVTGEEDPLGFWAERDLRPAVEENYEGSIFLVHGLQDWNVDPQVAIPWVDHLNRTGTPVHYLLGQWGHSWPDQAGETSANQRWDWAEILFRWLERELKGEDVPLGPAVQVLDSEDRWRVDDAYPPRDVAWTTFHLSGDGALVDAEPSPGSFQLLPQAVDAGGVVPQPVPGTSADFLLPAAEEELLISGLPRAHVTVTPQGPGGGLAAWLYSVHPDGTEERLGWAMINLRFADGTREARDVTPGEPLLVKMELQPMEGAVQPGERLLLRVWQYRDAPPGDEVQGRLPVLPPMPVTLQVGGGSHAELDLPLIRRGGDAYFTPPYPQ